MTETLSRPSRVPLPRPARTTGQRAGRPLQSGAVAALWAALAGLVAVALPVLLVWATDGRAGSGAGEALRAAAQVWLVGHSTSLEVPGGTLGLSPLGLALLPLVALARAGAHAARDCRTATLRDAVTLTGAVAGPYAVLATVVAGVTASSQVRPVPLQALAGAFLLGLLGAGVGIVRTARLVPVVKDRLSDRAVRLVTATAAALAVLFGAGALLVGVSLAVHVGRAADLTGATGPGPIGGVALLVLGVALVPNAVIWGTSYLVGTGFAVGVGTAVGPFSTTLGAVPAFPLLAALPGGAPPLAGGLAALVVPLVAGGVAGLLVVRRLGPASWWQAAGEAALVGPCAGLVLAAMALLSGGPLGDGRLAQVGPSAWRLGLVAALELAVAAAAVGALLVGRRSRS